ncbi:hypothetical protein H310_04240 [Aphanomyces invadans]|uniref:Uncharacterized protein n=1 Tax=Aphanomyces invadans TaxID=157072 RepID=A0A024UI36_9STRA|nr:hypothetical protein H310_04240 [Aphanomyces invadans]ETW05283.1 hypothetical protein H310_04240 [Aphanomyces invadans]|eukprot:XP_008866721.1 hypothetical protein H310_04240 [Aphanomyces invadans]
MDSKPPKSKVAPARRSTAFPYVATAGPHALPSSARDQGEAATEVMADSRPSPKQSTVASLIATPIITKALAESTPCPTFQPDFVEPLSWGQLESMREARPAWLTELSMTIFGTCVPRLDAHVSRKACV